MNRPTTSANLTKAIRAARPGEDTVRLARAMGGVVVGQMLPDGVIKGGSSLLFRYGAGNVRYTRDMDTARTLSLDAYVTALERALAAGWNGFTGRLATVAPPSPLGVPRAYVMMPFDIKLAYNRRPWQTLRIEVGHDEIGDADRAETVLPGELAELFERLGFPRPRPLPVMTLAHQVAQKLHALSAPDSERAHDLVDLQLIARHSPLDLAEVRDTCIRLFAYRRAQSWPPSISKGRGWDDLYAAAGAGLPVEPDADRAIAWIQGFIREINGARASDK